MRRADQLSRGAGCCRGANERSAGAAGRAALSSRQDSFRPARLTKTLDLDLPNARVTVEPGVINAQVTQRVAPHGYFYAPDPSSQSVCTIGGNIAENSGGAHCLKYGFTTTHVLGMEVVLPDGSLVTLGAPTCDAPGYDLRGVF